MSGDWLHKLYAGLSSALTPALRVYLKRRAKRGKEDAARLEERFGRASAQRPEGRLVWLHGASVGESLSALPLLRAILDANPNASALVTSGTVTSAALLAERLPKRAIHQYLPLDQPASVKRFLDHWKPDLALWIESELWPNMLGAIRDRGAPAALVNARLSEKSFATWRKAPGLARRVLSTFEMSLSQTQETADRLIALGAADVRVTGNLKAAAAPLPARPDALQALGDMIANRPVVVATSTHAGEEEILARAFLTLKATRPDLLLALAPRHPERGPEIAETLRGLNLAVSRRGAKVRIVAETNVYLMDTIGELGLLYRLSPFAYVGGGLVPHGGQNPLEPARLGVPALHGPHVFNFRGEYADLDAAGGAKQVADADELAEAAAAWLDDPEAARRAGAAALEIALKGAGAFDAVKQALAPLLERAGFDAPA